MNGLIESELMLSSVCCADHDPTVRSGNYRLLGQFETQSLSCPAKPDTVRPDQLTSTDRGCSNRTIPARSLIYRAPERLESGLSAPRVHCYTS